MAWTFYNDGAEKTTLEGVSSNAVRAKTSVAQSIPTNTFTTVTFELEDFDYGGLHSTTTNTGRLTAQATGVYFIYGSLNFAANLSGDRGVRILLNGSTVIARQFGVTSSTAGEQPSISCGTYYYLVAGQYVELNAFQNSGSSLALDLTATPPSFGMGLISTISTGGVGGASTVDELSDADTTVGLADGSLFRFESTEATWKNTTSSTLLLSDAGQLQVPTTGASGGLLVGGDVNLYRSGPNVLSLGTGDKIQSDVVATSANDLTNQVYVDRLNFFMGA